MTTAVRPRLPGANGHGEPAVSSQQSAVGGESRENPAEEPGAAPELAATEPLLPLHSAHAYAMFRLVDAKFRPLKTLDRRYFFRLDVPERDDPWCAEEVEAALAWLQEQRRELSEGPGVHKVLCPVCSLNAEFPEYDEEGNAGEVFAPSERCKLLRGELLGAFAAISAAVHSRRTELRERREAARIREELESRKSAA